MFDSTFLSSGDLPGSIRNFRGVQKFFSCYAHPNRLSEIIDRLLKIQCKQSIQNPKQPSLIPQKFRKKSWYVRRLAPERAPTAPVPAALPIALPRPLPVGTKGAFPNVCAVRKCSPKIQPLHPPLSGGVNHAST